MEQEISGFISSIIHIMITKYLYVIHYTYFFHQLTSQIFLLIEVSKRSIMLTKDLYNIQLKNRKKLLAHQGPVAFFVT